MQVVLGPWQALGPVQVDVAGNLILPAPPPEPGLYRFRLGSDAAVYVGEAENLVVRFRQYAKPGPSQRTNIRINGKMREHLSRGQEVAVDLCTEAFVDVESIDIGSIREPLDLSRRSHRILAEEAAIADAKRGTMGKVLNIAG